MGATRGTARTTRRALTLMMLIGGEAHRAYALFLFPETTW
jgi:hypothetical protein